MAYYNNRNGGWQNYGGQNGNHPNRSNSGGQRNSQQKGPDTVYAPYNFVPFTERKPFLRYDDVSELPAHDALREELYTGEIRLTLTAETPVFVSNGAQDADFFKGANGEYMIPGSTVRGLARENMQIMGDGLVRPGEDLEDVRIFYRQLAAAKKSIGGDLKGAYQKKLDIRRQEGYQYPLPKNVRSGYLVKRGKGGDAPYRIYQTSVPALFASRSVIRREFPFHSDIKKAEGTGIRPVCYTANGRIAIGVYRPGTGRENMKKGVLLYTNGYISQKPNHQYIFPQFDGKQPFIDVSAEDIIAYQMDCRRCKKHAPYILPDGPQKEPLPVFYVETVDAKGEKHVYFGLTQYPRIGHTHSLADGLPTAQLDKREAMPLDYPHAILGFTHDAGKKNTAYRSRVSFGDFAAQGGAKPEKGEPTILGEPKPSFYAGYAEQGKHYSDAFRLRGFKQYWFKEAKLPEGLKRGNMDNIIKPMGSGTVFKGTVQFKNLHRDELGLLLWALALDEGCSQSIGKAKPYGFGRVKVTVDGLYLTDTAKMYTAAGFAGRALHREEDFRQYIADYKAYIDEMSEDAVPVDKRPEIAAFLYMKRTVREDRRAVEYIRLGGDRGMSHPLPTVAEIRKKVESRSGNGKK